MTRIHVLHSGNDELAPFLEERVPDAGGLVYIADFSRAPEEDPWQEWVVAPSTELLLHAGKRVLEGDTEATVLVVKLRHDERDGELSAFREAAMESLRGANGSIALERAAERALTNMVVIDETTTEHDIAHAVTYLLDPRYNGFTTGATLHLTGQTASDSIRRPGKVLVTGGGGTIGLETARAYQEAGYEPVLVDLSQERLALASEELGGVDTHVADLTDRDAVQSLASTGDFENLTSVALVHGFQGSSALGDLTADMIGRSISINGTSVAMLIEAFAPLLVKNHGSFSIVSSQAGIRAEAVTSAYSAPKFALVGLNRGLEPVLEAQGVSINTLAPGPVNTPLLRAYFERFAGNEGQDVDSVIAERAASMPLGRFAVPAEMAHALRFLSQLDATGVLLAPTGGETLT